MAGCHFTIEGLAADASIARSIALPTSSALAATSIVDMTVPAAIAWQLARTPSTPGLAPFGNGQPNTGYGLGYFGMDGIAVELDTFQNGGNGDPDNNHVALMRTSDGTHLLTGTPPAPPLHSSSGRTAHIRFTGAHVTVEIDNMKTIDADVPPN